MELSRIGLGAVLGVCLAMSAAAGPVNINTADAATLAAELNGIGPALAEAIVRDRAANGKFDSAEALTRVKGVGEKIVERNRENIRVSDPAPR